MNPKPPDIGYLDLRSGLRFSKGLPRTIGRQKGTRLLRKLFNGHRGPDPLTGLKLCSGSALSAF